MISWAPGRINIIGEHTDYNNGFVLPAAINRGTRFEIESNGTPDTVRLRAKNLNESVSFKISSAINLPTWAKYLYGVLMEISKYSGQIMGFNAEFSGNVPIGSGLSSSASLECSFAIGLNELWDLKIDNWQIIKACQMAEHHYVGIKCGIMDQFASVMGKDGHVVRLDCSDLSYEYIPCDLIDYEIVLLNTNVSHELANSAYNERREQCESAVNKLKVKYPHIKSLRDVDTKMLNTSKIPLTRVEHARAQHIITENDRVLQASEALLGGHIKTLGKLMYQSHESLSTQYEVSCPELDYLVYLSKDNTNVIGSRMMGGGFGGCTINLVKKGHTVNFIEQLAELYNNKFNISLNAYQLAIGNGACLL